MAPPFESTGIRAILLDIEGTTTPIDFVFNTLFPFASAHAQDFFRRHFRQADVARLLEQLRAGCEWDAASGAPIWTRKTEEEDLAGAAAYVRWLIARDSKATPLKAIQGKIWEEGFQSGELKGQVYPDVGPAFRRWKSQGRRVAIFSSGSALAQKLLFRNSTAGDLSLFLEGYFDTTSGPKREAASYRKIADSLRVPLAEWLFVSDVAEELDAARAAQMKTAHSLRPGIRPLSDKRHWEIPSFNEIFPGP